jgi:hypothetical protein
MLQKRGYLINQFAEGIDVDEIYGNLNFHIQNYEDLTHASERVTLLIYDLVTAMKINEFLHKSSLIKLISVLLPPSRMLATSGLLVEKIRRKKLRTRF